MLPSKDIRLITEKVLKKHGFEFRFINPTTAVYAGYGASGRVCFPVKNGRTHFRFCYNNEFLLPVEKDWKNEKLCFSMANHFSKLKEDLFKIYYESPGTYECVSIAKINITNLKTYEIMLDYIICVAIEGYAVLNCENFYKKASARKDIMTTFEKNISSLGSWGDPGGWVKHYS